MAKNLHKEYPKEYYIYFQRSMYGIISYSLIDDVLIEQVKNLGSGRLSPEDSIRLSLYTVTRCRSTSP